MGGHLSFFKKEPWQEIEHELEIGIDRNGLQPIGVAFIK
jgi:hypothetical protein